jgi:RHS repeat-associated protein
VGTSDDYVSSYGFDLAGNRVIQKTDHATTNLNEFLSDGDMIPDEAVTSSFDANDRLNNQVDDNLSDDSQDRNTVFSYGGTGDPGTEETDETVRTGTVAGSGTKVSEKGYTYDVQGRMSGAVVTSYQADGTTIQSQSTSTYKYDPDGMRIGQVVNDGSTTTTTNYVIDKNNPTGLPQTIEEKDGSGNITKTYTIGLDVLTQYDSTNGALTLLYDGHGSTRAISNASRQILQRFAYDAYGNLLSGVNLTTVNALTSLLYSGEQTDSGTGLQYLRARMYDPRTGRFETTDPAKGWDADPQSLHRYLYAYGNPTNRVDPDGRFSFLEITVVTASIVTIASASGAISGLQSLAVGGSFWDGFSRAFLSTGISTSLIIFAKCPPNIAFAVGAGASDIVLDLIEGDYGTKENAALSIFKTVIDIVAGGAFGTAFGTWFENVASADAGSLVHILATAPEAASVRAAAAEIFKVATAAGVSGWGANVIDRLADLVFDAVKASAKVFENMAQRNANATP